VIRELWQGRETKALKDIFGQPIKLEMSSLWSELEQEPYDPEEFVERLAWRATNTSGGAAPSDDLDSGQLHEAFVLAIKDLTFMHEKQKKKCQQLEQVSRTRTDHVV